MGDVTRCLIQDPDDPCTPGVPRLARGWCDKHYKRWQVHGDPRMVKPPKPFKRDVNERFWSKVNKDGPLVPGYPDMGPCWIWVSKLTVSGYGVFFQQIDGWKTYTAAHRWAYKALVGPIPDGYDLDHMCHNLDLACRGGASCPHRRCLNPGHAIPATRAQNLKRGRHNIRQTSKTHCVNNHEFAGDNVYIDSRGSRQCRTCQRASKRRQVERQKTRSLPAA